MTLTLVNVDKQVHRIISNGLDELQRASTVSAALGAESVHSQRNSVNNAQLFHLAVNLDRASRFNGALNATNTFFAQVRSEIGHFNCTLVVARRSVDLFDEVLSVGVADFSAEHLDGHGHVHLAVSCVHCDDFFGNVAHGEGEGVDRTPANQIEQVVEANNLVLVCANVIGVFLNQALVMNFVSEACSYHQIVTRILTVDCHHSTRIVSWVNWPVPLNSCAKSFIESLITSVAKIRTYDF